VVGYLRRLWLRPQRGISQENVPLSVGFFEFVHNLIFLPALFFNSQGVLLSLAEVPKRTSRFL
jgi:hypothetical protein